jgi:hypothetical protein
MSAKEKAEELVDKYFSELRLPPDCEGCMQCVDRCGNMVAVAKKYALIAVDEILKSNPIIPLEYMLESEALDAAVQYWQQVKTEIGNL